MLKIEKIELVRASVPRKVPFELAGGTFAAAAHVFVRVTLEDGTIGYGESSPMVLYSEESQSTAFAMLVEYLAPAVVGCDALNMASVHQRMNRAVRMNPTAKAGLDMAIYDAVGKSLGVPVHALLGGAYRDRIPLAESVGVLTDDAVVDSAKAVVDAGFKVIKLKGGRDVALDIRRLELIRKAVGNDFPVRLDANAGYPGYDRAIRHLLRAQELQLSELEQPLQRFDLAGMARLAADLTTPVIADESVFSASDAAAVIALHAADAINVKVAKSGGMHPAIRIAAVAEASEVGTLVGALQETGIGTAASLHLAAACRTLAYASDTRTHRAMLHTLIRNDLRIADGEAHVPMEPGLGIVVDEEALERYADGHWSAVVSSMPALAI